MIRVTLVEVNQFILQKNYLAVKKASNIAGLINNLIGLPGKPLTTPFLSARARLANFTPNQLLSELYQNRSLIKSALMRNSAYIVNTEQYLVWHAATTRQRNKDFNAEFRLWGIESNDDVERWGQAILDVLDDEPLTAETITQRLPQDMVKQLSQTSRGGRVTTTGNVALALRWLAAKGMLGVSRNSSDWRVEEPIYARLTHWHPGLDLSKAPDEAEAQKLLARDYLAAFGPATEADLSFWTGFSKRETARAVAALSGETILTMVEGIPGMLLTLKSQTDALKAVTIPPGPVVNVLPADDPFTTAHRASRARYYNDQTLQRRIFSSSGPAKPAILINGQIVGVWDWQMENDQDIITWQLLTELHPPLIPQIQTEVERVAHFIGSDCKVEQKIA
jgi:hypothetical protein